MMILMMLLSACESIPVNNYCLWGHPILTTNHQLELMRMDSSMHSLLRQIDSQQQEWKIRCGNNIV